jgi:hypothetical protein
MRRRLAVMLLAVGLALGGAACDVADGDVDVVEDDATVGETPEDDETTEEPTDEATGEDDGNGDSSGEGG